MRNFVSFRITAAACWFFAALSLIGPFRFALIPAAAVTALIFAASFIAVRFNKPVIRLLFMALPFAGVALARYNAFVLVGCAVPAVYAAAAVASGFIMVENWRYIRLYSVLAMITPAFIIMSFVPIFGNTPTKIFVPLFLVFGILALRAGRAGNVRSARWQAGNAMFFVIPLVVSLALGLGLGALLPYISFIFLPIAALFGLVITGWNALMSNVFQYSPSEPEASALPTPLPTSDLPEEEGFIGMLTDNKNVWSGSFRLDMPWAILGILVLVAILVVALVMLFKRRGVPGREEEDDFIFTAADGEKTPSLRRSRKKKVPNADAIRKIYAQYLTYLRTWGVKLKTSNTSQEVSDEAYKSLLKETDEELRSLYIRARYGDPKSITDEDVKKAQEAFEKLTDYDTVRKAG